jgi:hypothetical protein
MAVRLSALRAGRPLSPGRFLVLISVRGWVRLEGLGQMKNPVKSGIEPASLLICSIVPQPTTLLRTPILIIRELQNSSPKFIEFRRNIVHSSTVDFKFPSDVQWRACVLLSISASDYRLLRRRRMPCMRWYGLFLSPDVRNWRRHVCWHYLPAFAPRKRGECARWFGAVGGPE